jgi:hypothetical protein
MARCRYEFQKESVFIPGRREDQYQPEWCQVMKRQCQSSTWKWRKLEKTELDMERTDFLKMYPRLYVLIPVTQLILLPYSVRNIIRCCVNVLSWGRTLFLCDTSV